MQLLDAFRRVQAHAGSMRHEIAEGHQPGRSAQRHLAGALRFHDPLPAKLRQILFDRIRDAQFAFLGQHHDGQRHDRLGHGVNLEDRVSLDRLPSFQIV
jgi:hypothetical protein